MKIIKIFEGLYDLRDGTYLKWNRMSMTWKIVGNVSFDNLELELPDVKFEEIKIYFDINKLKSPKPKTKEQLQKQLYDKIIAFSEIAQRNAIFGCNRLSGMPQFKNIFDSISKHEEVNFKLLANLRRSILIEQGFDVSGINFELYIKVLEEKFKRL